MIVRTEVFRETQSRLGNLCAGFRAERNTDADGQSAPSGFGQDLQIFIMCTENDEVPGLPMGQHVLEFAGLR